MSHTILQQLEYFCKKNLYKSSNFFDMMPTFEDASTYTFSFKYKTSTPKIQKLFLQFLFNNNIKHKVELRTYDSGITGKTTEYTDIIVSI